MPLSTVQRDRINATLLSLFNEISTKQGIYFSGQEIVTPAHLDFDGNTIPAVTRIRNRYWQGIRTATVAPTAGTAVAPDLTRRPTDQTEGWADFGATIPATLEVALTVDVYDAPLGKGWTASVEVKVGAEVWRRSRAVGPEAPARTTGWVNVTPVAVS